MVHNRARTADHDLDRHIRRRLVIKSTTGRITRRRKAQMYRIERANLRALILQVAQHLAQQDRGAR